MKKHTLVAGTALLVLSAASAANGAATLCVDFAFPFCDALELTVEEDNSITGRWANWDCLGNSLEVSGARISTSRARVFCLGAQCPNGISWMFDISAPERMFDLFGWDMVDPPFFQALGHPFFLVHDICPFHQAEAGTLPSWQADRGF